MRPSSTRRKFLTTTGATAVGVSVVGCLGDDDDGNGNGADDGDGDDTDPGQTDVDVDVTGDYEVEEEVEIDFLFSIGGNKGQVVDQMATQFSNLSDTITVEAIHEGNYGDTWNATLQGIRADDPPEVVHLNANHTLQGWAENAYIPVENILPDRLDHDDFIPAVTDYYVFQDTLLGLPFSVSTIVAHFNSDAFEEAGLASHPDDITMETFEEYRNISQDVMDAGATPHGATWPNHNWFYESWFANQGADFVDNDNGRSAPAEEALVTEEPGQRLFDWIMEMENNEEYLHASGWGDARQGYVNEQAAILIDSSSNIQEMTEGASQAGFESRVGDIPAYDDWHGLIIGGGSLFVPQGVDGVELQAAAEFLLWMSQPEQQAHFHSNTGYYPTSQEAVEILEEDGFYDENPQFWRAYQQLANTEESSATQGAFIMNHPQVRDEMTDAFTRMLQDTPVDEALEGAKAEIDDLLADGREDDPRAD